MSPSQPTPEERIADLESQLAAAQRRIDALTLRHNPLSSATLARFANLRASEMRARRAELEAECASCNPADLARRLVQFATDAKMRDERMGQITAEHKAATDAEHKAHAEQQAASVASNAAMAKALDEATRDLAAAKAQVLDAAAGHARELKERDKAAQEQEKELAKLRAELADVREFMTTERGRRDMAAELERRRAELRKLESQVEA